MSLFSSVKTFGGSWTVASQEKLTAAEKKQIKSAVVKEAEHGPYVCFMMKGGQMRNIFAGRDSQDLVGGEEVNLNSVEILELERDGDENLIRIEASSK